jgi:hypothetical protein
MQTVFNVNPDIAIEGQPHGSPRQSRPRLLPYLAQITTGVIADSEAGTYTISIQDDVTLQVHTLAVTISGAVEATSLDEILAAWEANGKFNDLFTIVEDGVDTWTVTARHANRLYTITVANPGSMTTVIAITQGAGGAELEMGRFVAKGTGDDEFVALGATTVLANVLGILFRTDANHFHALENELPTDVDTLARGRHYPIMEKGRCWMIAEDAVTPASSVFARRALTSSAGDIGRVRGTAVGAAQVSTVAPTVNHQHYAISFDFEGQQFDIAYTATDETTAVADAIDGLFDNAVEQLTAAGIETVVVATESATLLTLTVAAGREITNLRNAAHGLDVEAVSTVVVQGAADVDTIDVSSIAEFETTAAAGGLVLLKLKGLV